MRKYLIPDSNDQIRQQQMREIQVGSVVEVVVQLYMANCPGDEADAVE